MRKYSNIILLTLLALAFLASIAYNLGDKVFGPISIASGVLFVVLFIIRMTVWRNPK